MEREAKRVLGMFLHQETVQVGNNCSCEFSSKVSEGLA